MTAIEERIADAPQVDTHAIEAVLDRLVSARGTVAAAVYGYDAELVAARGEPLLVAAFGVEQLATLTSLGSATNGRY